MCVCVRATSERVWNQFLHCSQLQRFIKRGEKKKKLQKKATRKMSELDDTSCYSLTKNVLFSVFAALN